MVVASQRALHMAEPPDTSYTTMGYGSVDWYLMSFGKYGITLLRQRQTLYKEKNEGVTGNGKIFPAHTIKTCGGGGGRGTVLLSLTSTADEGELSISCSGSFTPSSR
jgi:hypothetical protein